MKNRKWMALALAAAMVGSLTACVIFSEPPQRFF